MPLRLSIPELSAVKAASSEPRFRSELLRPSWPQKLSYLREVYSDIQKTADDKSLFAGAEPGLRELIFGLGKIGTEINNRPDVHRIVANAQRDFQTAETHAKEANHELADVYASYALLKLSNVIDGLTVLASKHVKAYGYDISGQAFGPGERESRSPNLWDQSNSPKNNKTPTNPANQLVDSEAESDYPKELADKRKKVQWPARTR